MASENDAHDVILHHIFKQTQGEAGESMQAGVALRVENSPVRFRVFPYENLSLAPFEAAVRGLNPLVAVKIRSASVDATLAMVSEEETGVFVDKEIRIQIIDTIADLPAADKEQSAAFIRDDCVLICWSDNLDSIIPTCKELEEKLISLIWKVRPDVLKTPGSGTPSIRSLSGYDGMTMGGSQHTLEPITTQPAEKYHSGNEKNGFIGWMPEEDSEAKKAAPHVGPNSIL